MDRVQTYVAAQQILAAELNNIQAQAVGASTGQSLFNILFGCPPGLQALVYMMSGPTGAGSAPIVLETSRDWRDAMLYVFFRHASGLDQQPGAIDDVLNDGAATLRIGYTGRGGLNGASAPSAGNPPIPLAGASWALQITTDVWLYASAANGNLTYQNNSAGTLYPLIAAIFATPATGFRP